MPIGEVFLGAILTVLFENISSPEFVIFVKGIRIDVQLNQWTTKLSSIRTVLTDAENRQTGNLAVKKWLKDLEYLVYDLDDLVDELNTEAQHRKSRENEASNSSTLKCIATCGTNSCLADLMFDRKIAPQLKEISGRLEDLLNQINVLNLVANVGEGPYRTAERLQPTSVVEESEIYGRKNEKEDILKILLKAESSSDNQISVIPVVGMGGIGKSTLVQLVYNDVRLQNKFDVKAWACVSDKFHHLSITKTILKQVSSETCDNDDFVILQGKLKNCLSNKKFLVVLDDVWNEKYGDWNTLITPFHAGKAGSKIIITTRLQSVANIMSHSPAYHLNVLSDTDALSLFAKHAFGAKKTDVREIGSLLVRCQNLPLAVMILGGHLRKIPGGYLGAINSPKEWEHVLNEEVLPVLKLSYQYLKPELKRCFEYFAIFPKDYEFDKSQLVFLWIVEGLVKHLEEGNRHFDELVDSSLLQQSNTSISRFMMHGLLNDLAGFIAGDKCLMMDDMVKENHSSKISEKVRHLSFIRHECESYDRFNFVKESRSLRTFLPLPIEPQCYPQFLSQNILLDLLPKLNRLRVLSLNGYSIYELPDAISNLRLLRYLDLTKTLLKCLPESLRTLINLQVLILRGCSRLTKLPARMENLINLRHLNIAETPQLDEIPQGIAQLKSLQTLSKIIVSRSSGMRLKDLGNLKHLQGEISIVGLQNVANVQEAIDARLTDKPGLNKIKLVWSNEFDDYQNGSLELDVLDALKPHENTSSLEIEFYGGSILSSWIGDLSLSKLAKISFHDCKRCTDLPTLGHLPLLTDLSIRGMNQLKVIGLEFYGILCSGDLPFQALESLIFEDMPQWEEWLGVEGVIQFPNLRKLGIKRCPNLLRLPILSLASVCGLEVEECSEKVLNSMRDLTSLTQLKLKKIFSMTSIVKAFVQFPLALKKIEIENCEDLVNLWSSDNSMQSLVNLERVVVAWCPKLLSIQEIGILPRIECLRVENCSSLESLPENRTSYRELYIGDCPSLKNMTVHNCSLSLESLVIYRWVNLNLANVLGSVNNYSSLTELCITGFDGTELFPSGGLPTPNLRDLKIINSPNLKSLPGQMERLRFLQLLWVHNCPLIVKPFSQGNIPLHLNDLSISNCGNLNPLSEWGLQNRTSLHSFHLEGGYPELDSFFKDDDRHCLLPPSLTRLHFSNLPKLEILSEGFQNLTSLRYLQITNCPKLVALPMACHLDGLWSFKIKDCLPLKKLCLKNKKDLCPIIAHIPQVEVDGRSIYEPVPCP